MALPLFTMVRLSTDCHLSEGVGTGAIGFVVEVHHDDAYEVEFSREADGTTIALLTLSPSEFDVVSVPESAVARGSA
ncbi:MAG TPA: DUF4926 domain-containing protein [Thermomicrobiales bacterium]|jgi:hypothetical protein